MLQQSHYHELSSPSGYLSVIHQVVSSEISSYKLIFFRNMLVYFPFTVPDIKPDFDGLSPIYKKNLVSHLWEIFMPVLGELPLPSFFNLLGSFGLSIISSPPLSDWKASFWLLSKQRPLSKIHGMVAFLESCGGLSLVALQLRLYWTFHLKQDWDSLQWL